MVNIANADMIKSILGPGYFKSIQPNFVKYFNSDIEVIFENNKNIAVYDKRNKKFYCDLKSAYLAFTNLKELP